MAQDELEDAKKKFEELKGKNPRLAGEYAYVLAVACHRRGNGEKSRYYARECQTIFSKLNIQDINDAVSRLNIVCDVCLPALIHEGVVEQRFREIGIF